MPVPYPTRKRSLYVFSMPMGLALLFTGRRDMQTRSFVVLDVHNASISVSLAEDGRNGEFRFLGAIPNTPDEGAKLAKRLSRHVALEF